MRTQSQQLRQPSQRGRDKIDELIHRPPNFVFEGLQQLRYLILTEGLAADANGDCHYRNYVWTILLQVDLSQSVYASLIKQRASRCDAKIQNDTFRTLATDKNFKARVREDALSRILNGWANLHPEGCGYVQGMNVLAAPFLYISRSESQAFALFDKFLTCYCPTYITPTLIGVHTALELVDLVLKIADPNLYAHLKAKMLPANLYAFASIMTFSAGTPPLNEALKLWDIIMAYGCHLNILFVVAQVVRMREALLQSSKPMTLLRSFPPLKAKEISTTALGILQKVPEDLYDLLVRHGVDANVQHECKRFK